MRIWGILSLREQPFSPTGILRQKKFHFLLEPVREWGGKIVDIFEKWSKEAVKRLVKIIDVATEFKQSFGLFSSFCNSSLFPIIIQCRGVDRDFSRRLAWVRSYRRASPHRVRSRHRQSWGGTGAAVGWRLRGRSAAAAAVLLPVALSTLRPRRSWANASARPHLRRGGRMAAVVRRVQWCDVENVVCLSPHKKLVVTFTWL